MRKCTRLKFYNLCFPRLSQRSEYSRSEANKLSMHATRSKNKQMSMQPLGNPQGNNSGCYSPYVLSIPATCARLRPQARMQMWDLPKHK